MEEVPATSTASVAAAILDALVPLLTSSDSTVVTSAVDAIREAKPTPVVLASSLYAFSKLVLSFPDTVAAFREAVGSLVSTTLLPRAVLYEAIDVETHQLLEPTIARASEEKRMRTRLWFTQTRFNLFREESEGYAKVMTLMWDTVTAPDIVNQSAVVEALLALIGQFSLDTNRVIELVLSAAADVVTEQRNRAGNIPFDHRLPPLFVMLLDEFPRDHVFSVVGAMLQSYHPIVSSELAADRETSKHAPSPAPGLAASAAIESATEAKASAPKTPEALYYLIGILMREGRMRIADVWHNLYPRDDRELAKRFLAYEEQLQALSKHAASPSANRPANAETPALFVRSGPSASERDVLSLYKWVNAGPFAQYACQKLHFIFVLIIMCRVDDVLDAVLSLGVDGEHIDVAAHPVIAQALAAFAEALLNPLLNSTYPGFYRDNSHISEAIARLGGRGNRCPCTVATVDELLDSDDDGAGAVILRILQVLGPHARTSPGLLQAICKLIKGRDEPRAIALMQDVVLPASSLLQSNVGLTNDIWGVVRNWPHTVRWQLYGNLHHAVAGSSAAYHLVAKRASYEMRYVLKRLTKETQKQHVTTIGKITRGQALPAFSAAIDRIQGYPPDAVTISPVVEACLECSDLAVDMLLFLIIDRMSDSRRSRLKDDGINIAQWYATLSLFLGLCLRKLQVNSQQIEGVLGFLYTKLVLDQEALLITALSDIIVCVADIEIESNLTAKQIEAHGGGHQLRAAASGFWGRLQPDVKMVGHSFDPKVEREKKCAALALLTAFKRTGIHVPIAIAIAQMSRGAVYQDDLRTMPLKLGAHIVDRARSSLSQLSRFMDSSPTTTTWEKELREDIWRPLQEIGPAALISEMGVLTPFATVLISPVLTYLVQDTCSKELETKFINGAPNEVTSDAQVPSLSGNKIKGSESPGKPEATPGHDGSKKGESTTVKPHKEQQSILAFARIIAKRCDEFVSVEFARAFWTLKLDDIAVPIDMYETEKRKLLLVKSTWEKEVDRNRRHTNHVDSDRRRRCESEARKIREFVNSLDSEKIAFVQKQKSTIESLGASHSQLCSGKTDQSQADKARTVRFVLQECILPRCKVSICDAIFCSKYMLLMLTLDIPVVCFSAYFQGLLKLTPVVLRSCSENEALSFARLLKEVLTTLEKWRSNRKTFDKEAAGEKKYGFRDPESHGTKPLRHEQYCQWLFDIHENLAEGLCQVLVSDEYLYTRNSLYVLAGIVDVFPKVSEHAIKLEECVAKISASDLPDIRLSSTGVLARLKSGQARRLPQHIFKLKPSTGSSAAASGGKRRTLPQRGSKPSPAASSKTVKPSGTSLEANAKQETRTSEKTRPHPPGMSESRPSGKSSPNDGNRNAGQSLAKTSTAEPTLNPGAQEFVPTADRNVGAGNDNTTVGSSTGKRGRESGSGSRNSPDEKPKSDVGKVADAGSEPPPKRPKNGGMQGGDGAGGNVVKNKPPEVRPKSSESKAPNREVGGRTSNAKGTTVQKTPTNASQKASAQKPHPPNRDTAGREAESRDDGNRGTSGPAGRNGALRDTSSRGTPNNGSGNRENPARSPSHQDTQALSSPGRVAPMRGPSGRDASRPSPPGRDPSGRGPTRRESAGRGVSGRDSSGRNSPRRGVAGRSPQRRDASSRNAISRDSHSRGSLDRERSGRDGMPRDDAVRSQPRRHSPGQNMQRHPARGDTPTRDPVRETNGISGKDSIRRRRVPDGQGGHQFNPGPDGRMLGRDPQEYDSFGDGHGVKRRRENNPPRDAYPFDGEGRRPTRQRTEGSYRERPLSREPMNERFNGPQSPPRESGRFDNGFSGQGPLGKPGWGDHGRPRSHDALHDARPGSGGGLRRRDHEPDPVSGWKGRPGERGGEFEGRDRPPVRGREDGRDGEYNNYDERGANRGGDRFADRRNGGREDRGPRDRAFGRKGHGRQGGRRRG